jgi:hypothetical protein
MYFQNKFFLKNDVEALWPIHKNLETSTALVVASDGSLRVVRTLVFFVRTAVLMLVSSKIPSHVISVSRCSAIEYAVTPCWIYPIGGRRDNHWRESALTIDMAMSEIDDF